MVNKYARYAKNILLSYKSLILGLAFILLIAVLFCGHFQIVSNLIGTAGAECGKTIFMANYSSFRENILFTFFLFSVIALVMLLRRKIIDQQHFNASLRLSPIFLNVAQFIFKLHNPILQAFRRGILHPQIYNFAVITG